MYRHIKLARFSHCLLNNKCPLLVCINLLFKHVSLRERWLLRRHIFKATSSISQNFNFVPSEDIRRICIGYDPECYLHTCACLQNRKTDYWNKELS